MSTDSRSPACLDDEVLGSFAEGRLKRSEIPAVLAHLRDCPRCMSALEVANEIVGTKERRPLRWWWAGAAAAVIAGLLILVPMMWRNASPWAQLVKLAPADARAVETRLSVFAWAPYRGPLRAADPAEDARRLQLAGAAGDAVARANANPTAETQWTAGVALLLVGQDESALTRLRDAAQRAPSDAALWSDLAAALDAAAVRLERKSLHAEALAAADHALTIDAAHSAALFNRALILEHLGLGSEARKAWDRYLAVDASSQWASEAREHLRRLPASTGDARFREEQKNLARAAALVPEFPQQSRTYAEAMYLGRWGRTGDTASLDAARAIGNALVARSGESLLRDSVRVIDASHDERRAQLAEAHALYDRGRIELARQDPVTAQRDLREAAVMFAGASSPMAFLARHYAAAARFETDDLAGARAELERLRSESDAHPGYLALRALIEWQLATIAMSDADWAGALDHLRESEQRFRRLNERAHLAFVRGMQSTAMGCLGRPDEAWAARIEAFRALDAEGYGSRLPVTLGGAARMELHGGHLDTASSFLRLEVDSVRDAKNGALLANALVRETLLQMQLGDAAAAARAARDAMSMAESLSGPARELAVADATFAKGAAMADAVALTSAIDFYRASKRAIFLPQAYLLRARAALHSDDRAAALRDLDEGLDVLERHRQPLAGPLAGTDILDAGVALGREAIGLRVEMHDVAGAFREAERRNSRIGLPVTLDALQHSLAGTSTAVLMLTMLPKDAVAIAITEHEITTARAFLDERTLDARARGAAEADRDDAIALYDALVRPSGQALAGAQRLIVVADPLLREVPYAALYDRVAKRHLIEAMPVAVAESASSLNNVGRASARPGRAEARPTFAVAVALSSSGLDTLPDARHELEDVASLYPRTIAIESPAFTAFANAVARASVVHVAGHTARARGTNESALPFAERSATWRDLAAVRFDSGPVVILSACESLCDRLGGSMLTAGASDVIGTLLPIADRDAAEIFRDVHRGLAAGLDAADALRRAQLDALASEVATGRSSPWRAVAVLTRRIAPQIASKGDPNA